MPTGQVPIPSSGRHHNQSAAPAHAIHAEMILSQEDKSSMAEMEPMETIKKVEKGASFHEVTVSHAIWLRS